MGRSYLSLAAAALAYAVILELLLVAAILFFPNFEENIEALRMMAGISALKNIMTQIEDGGVVAYVVGQQFFKGCNTLGTAAAILFAVGAVAGEVHRGTFELWLARPYTRARLLTERYVAGALAVVVPVFLTSATIPALCDHIGEEVEMAPMMLSSVHQSGFLLAVYSLTFLCSTVGSNPTRIALVFLFSTTFSFATYMIEQVTDYSIFRWTDIDDFMEICVNEALLPGKLAVFLGTAALLYVAALVAIRRRVP
ncbi:MAG: ABC transporter permease subunit [Planctomycetota bacterium]